MGCICKPELIPSDVGTGQAICPYGIVRFSTENISAEFFGTYHCNSVQNVQPNHLALRGCSFFAGLGWSSLKIFMTSLSGCLIKVSNLA